MKGAWNSHIILFSYFFPQHWHILNPLRHLKSTTVLIFLLSIFVPHFSSFLPIFRSLLLTCFSLFSSLFLPCSFLPTPHHWWYFVKSLNSTLVLVEKLRVAVLGLSVYTNKRDTCVQMCSNVCSSSGITFTDLQVKQITHGTIIW